MGFTKEQLEKIYKEADDWEKGIYKENKPIQDRPLLKKLPDVTFMTSEDKMSDEYLKLDKVKLKASALGFRLFRNNRGLFRTLDNKRITKAGLDANGASDFVGIKTIEITPEMVGKSVGIFLAVEVKKTGWKGAKSQTEKDQANFIEQINKRGGIGFFCNDENELENLIAEKMKTMFDKCS